MATWATSRGGPTCRRKGKGRGWKVGAEDPCRVRREGGWHEMSFTAPADVKSSFHDTYFLIQKESFIFRLKIPWNTVCHLHSKERA